MKSNNYFDNQIEPGATRDWPTGTWFQRRLSYVRLKGHKQAKLRAKYLKLIVGRKVVGENRSDPWNS